MAKKKIQDKPLPTNAEAFVAAQQAIAAAVDVTRLALQDRLAALLATMAFKAWPMNRNATAGQKDRFHRLLLKEVVQATAGMTKLSGQHLADRVVSAARKAFREPRRRRPQRKSAGQTKGPRDNRA